MLVVIVIYCYCYTRLSRAGLLGRLCSSQVWVLILSVAAESRLNALNAPELLPPHSWGALLVAWVKGLISPGRLDTFGG